MKSFITPLAVATLIHSGFGRFSVQSREALLTSVPLPLAVRARTEQRTAYQAERLGLNQMIATVVIIIQPERGVSGV